MKAKAGFEHLWNLVDELLIVHQQARHALEVIEDCIDSVDGVTAPQNAVIVGESGVGKSTLIEVTRRQNPKYESKEGTVRPVVVVEIDEGLGLRNLPSWTLRALGDPRATKGTEFDMTSRVFKLAKGEGVKLFMFDEVQHFVEKEAALTLLKRANWFKRLTDETKAAIVLCGRPSLLSLTAADVQLRGRCETPVILPRFDWTSTAHKEEFAKILYGFDVGIRKHFDMPSLVDPDMQFRCYCACGGLMRPLARTLRGAVRQACKNGSRVITLEDLAAANRRQVADIGKLNPSDQPFCRGFRSQPTDKLLAHYSTVGADVQERAMAEIDRPFGAKTGPFGGSK